MNKSVCENCIPKRIVVSLINPKKKKKIPAKKVDSYKPDYQNTPLSESNYKNPIEQLSNCSLAIVQHLDEISREPENPRTQ